MSASINQFSTINQLDDLKTTLIPENRTRQEINRDDDWDNRWNWDTSELVYDDNNDDKKYIWLNECLISLSPFLDMLIIGRSKTVSIFHLKQNSAANNEFNPIYTTTLPGIENDETLTNIVLLPFVSQKKSAVNFRDWTAILTGFSSGYFRIYTENGKYLLLSQLFHDEPILDIKCRTYSQNLLLLEQTDEILIIYPTAIIQIDGFSLFQMIKHCRNRLMKSSDETMNIVDGGLSFFNKDNNHDNNQTPFTFKKWSFQTSSSDSHINDCVNVCSFIRNDFDALVSHSIDNGGGNKPLTNDYANLFFTTGTNPYVGFYRAQEGTTHAIIDELSQYLMNKVKNVFSFFNQQKSPKNDKEMIKPSTNVSADLSLFDERLGLKICLSPNRRLAAVTDDFGRVILFDMQNLIAIRIWKGYRRAEIGWIVIDEDLEQSSTDISNRKQAHFLVIYLPKRGILEIWSAQNGPRVTAFNVGKNCKLLYIDHTMFGLNYVILQNIKQTMSFQEYQQFFSYSRCFLFNYDTGMIFQFYIPFLCSLTDKNSKKTRDIHIMKDLKNLLKKSDSNIDQKTKFMDEIMKLISMLKTSEIRHECLDLICNECQDVNLILECTKNLQKDLLELLERNELDFENKLLLQMCARIIQLCQYYLNVKNRTEELETKFLKLIEQQNEQQPDLQRLTEQLNGWSENDVVRIISLLAFRQSVLKSTTTTNVTDEMKNNSTILNDFTINEMLSHFTLYYNHLVKNDQQEIYENLPIEIILMKENMTNVNVNMNNSNKKKKNQTTNRFENKNKQRSTINNIDNIDQFINLERLSKFLFFTTFVDDDDESNVKNLTDNVCILSSNLLLLLFTSWLNSDFSLYWPSWLKFSSTFNQIIDRINAIHLQMMINNENTNDDDDDGIIFDFSCLNDQLSPSWIDIIKLIYKSTNIPASFIAINMIKALINRIKMEKKIFESNEKDSNNETVNVNVVDDERKSLHSIISADNDEWETLHLDKENLNLLAKQLEDLFLLDLLLKSCDTNTKIPSSLNNGGGGGLKNIENISLSLLLTSGPGIVSEIVARWAIYHKIDPELFTDYKHIDECESKTNIDTSDNNVEILKNINLEIGKNAENELQTLTEKSTLIEILNHVRECFPNCLDSDILLINCYWELLRQWNYQPLLYNQIEQSLKYLELVSSSILKHNVAQMSWCLFIQKKFECLCHLIEKMGKKPKDRVIRKELEMDENNLEQFSNFICNLLDFMIRTSVSSETEALPLYTMNNWWNSFNSSTNNNNNENFNEEFFRYNLQSSSSTTIPLAMMAIHQKIANIDLLIEYYHLAQCIQFIIIFSVRNVHPLSLFSSTIRAYFFKKDLVSFLSNNNNDGIQLNDPVLMEKRKKFLTNTITSIVQTIPSYRNDDVNDTNTCQQFYIKANQWFGKLIDLAREWSIDIDSLRLHYVHQLYLYGCDPLADELMSSVLDIKILCRQLLIICGQRLCTIMNQMFQSLDECSFLPPNVLFWIKSLIIDPNCFTDVPKSSTILLLEKISNFLYNNNNSDNNDNNETNSDDLANYRISQELLLAFKRFV
uniref:Rab3 GTPase-activating protein non-catalytic subunit-like n=1 Tax=Dermatophagoides pteronyssinus TaxID=6956 RepID=A0A6P6XY69_DERPT|nr:rab3 GTPase-activating protein non-catalytic subunit-like [Dermatophagoides pteronyssinus]